MAKRIVVVAAVVGAVSIRSPVAQENKPEWPKKNDTVFISLDLPRVVQNETPLFSMTVPGMMGGPGIDHLAAASRPAMPLNRMVCDNTSYCWYFDPPCEALKILKVKPDTPLVRALDQYNVTIALASDFRPWTHASREVCEAALGVPPRPRLRYLNFALTIEAPDAPRRPEAVSVSVGGPFKPAGIVDVDAEPPQPPSIQSSPPPETEAPQPKEPPYAP